LILILITAAAAALAAALVLPGCGGSSSASAGQEEVVAGFYPLAFAAEEIAGGNTDVANLTPPGAEPHDLELSPRDVEAVQGADLVLLLGQDFQPQLEDAAGDGDNVLRVLDEPGLDLIPDDPHVWLDPIRFATIVRRIGTALHARTAARQLEARLEDLDRDYRRGLAHCERHEIVTSHAAFGYLADRYGLTQIAITGLSPEAEPDPARLAEVVDLVRAHGVTTIYFEPLLSPRAADTIARETGARSDVLNPVEGLTGDEAGRGEDYFTLMRRNLAALEEGLGCS
jgi:zinc transport system substrate-binding protein